MDHGEVHRPGGEPPGLVPGQGQGQENPPAVEIEGGERENRAEELAQDQQGERGNEPESGDEGVFYYDDGEEPDPEGEEKWFDMHMGEESGIIDDTNGEYVSMLLEEKCSERDAKRVRLEEAEEAVVGDDDGNTDIFNEEEDEMEREQGVGRMNLAEDAVSPSSPSLMGMPDTVLEAILQYMCQQPSEVCALELVCKRLRQMLVGGGFWDRHPVFKQERETTYCLLDFLRDHSTENSFSYYSWLLTPSNARPEWPSLRNATQEQYIFRHAFHAGNADRILASERRLLQTSMYSPDTLHRKMGVLSKRLRGGYQSFAMTTREKAFHSQFQKKVDEYQWNEEGANEILTVLGVDDFRSLAAGILARMMPSGGVRSEGHACTELNFRLRGDTVSYLAEVLQGHMLNKLDLALFVARNGDRYEVRKKDVAFSCRRNSRFQTLGQPLQPRPFHCDLSANDHGMESALHCSCSLPQMSGRLWRWPVGDCNDALPADAGRKIIRRLAFKAGITKMTHEAFILAEAELLHAMGILVVEAYEASFASSQSASSIAVSDSLSYNSPGGTVDMFRVPPPPIVVNHVKSYVEQPRPLYQHDVLESKGYTEENLEYDNDGKRAWITEWLKTELLYTIVPGQIRAAAEKREIAPSVVYGDTWIPSPGFTVDEERGIEESYYYQPFAKHYVPRSVEEIRDNSDDEMILFRDGPMMNPRGKGDTCNNASDKSESDESDSDCNEEDSSSDGYHTESSVESEDMEIMDADFWNDGY